MGMCVSTSPFLIFLRGMNGADGSYELKQSVRMKKEPKEKNVEK